MLIGWHGPLRIVARYLETRMDDGDHTTIAAQAGWAVRCYGGTKENEFWVGGPETIIAWIIDAMDRRSRAAGKGVAGQLSGDHYNDDQPIVAPNGCLARTASIIGILAVIRP